MKAMEPTGLPPHQETWCLEGTYTEKDLRAFAAFLARRVAGSKIWALGTFVLLPLLWSGNIRTTWPRMVPIAVLLIGFILLLRFVILPNKLYRAAIKLPGVFDPRRISIDEGEVHNTSDAGGHTFRLEDVREVIGTPEYLFVMVAPKQGIPIPCTWIGDIERVSKLREKLLSRSITIS
jgi:hypothetical protein